MYHRNLLCNSKRRCLWTLLYLANVVAGYSTELFACRLETISPLSSMLEIIHSLAGNWLADQSDETPAVVELEIES
jgi:hypothetical protein